MSKRRDLVPFDPHHFERLAAEGMKFTSRDAFDFIYRTGHWGGSQSVSGEGASESQTAELRQALPTLLQDLNTRTLLDLPCGDFSWMCRVPLPVDHYVGADLLPVLVAVNQARYGDEQKRFLVLDLTSDPLPPGDTLLCRDCLVHLSYADIERALVNILRSDVEHLLTTTFPACRANEDIVTGDWRPINLQLPPFNFVPPMRLISEGCTEVGGAFADKSLGVWSVRDLRTRVTRAEAS